MMLNINDDLELKRILVNRRKRMFCNILRHFEERNRKGIVRTKCWLSLKVHIMHLFLKTLKKNT